MIPGNCGHLDLIRQVTAIYRFDYTIRNQTKNKTLINITKDHTYNDVHNYTEPVYYNQ